MVKTNRKRSHVGFQNQAVEDKDKTLPQWKALPKEVLQLKCQARNLVVTGSVATLAKRLYNSYHINAAVMPPGAEEPDTQPEVVPPQAQPQPPTQPVSGPSHPPSQAGLFQASTTSSTIPPSVPQPAPVDQRDYLRSLLHEELSRLAPSLMASSNQVSTAPATMPPYQLQPEVPVNSTVGPQGTYSQPNFSIAAQEFNPAMEHISVTSLQSHNSHQHPSSSSNHLPANPWASGLPTSMFPTANTPSTPSTFSQFNPSPRFNPNLPSQPQLSVPQFRWMTPLIGSMYEKIMGREFIELCDLYGPDASQVSYEIQVDSDSRGQSVSLVPSKSKKHRLTDLHSWLEAWNTYIRLFVFYHPHMQNALLTYQTITCSHARMFKAVDWLRYDSTFRRSAAFDHTKPWDAVDQDLFDYFFKSPPTNLPCCHGCQEQGHFYASCPYREPVSVNRSLPHSSQASQSLGTSTITRPPAGIFVPPPPLSSLLC